MVINKKIITGVQTRIERVEKYCYLGTMRNGKWKNTKEIKCLIGKARTIFKKMNPFFKSHNLSLKTKMRHIRC